MQRQIIFVLSLSKSAILLSSGSCEPHSPTRNGKPQTQRQPASRNSAALGAGAIQAAGRSHLARIYLHRTRIHLEMISWLCYRRLSIVKGV